MSKQFVSWEQAVTWLVEQPEHQELVQQCYFDRPVLGAVKRYANSPEWKELTKYLPAGKGKAFDLGAGNGIVSYALAKEGWDVAALEPDPSQLVGAGAIRQFAESENMPIEVVEEWGEAIPYEDCHFDLVMARQVIHHANDLNQMYAEMARILKPGGTLIAFRDHIIDSDEGLKEFQDDHPLHNLYGGENAFRIEEYREAIRLAGLKVQSEMHQFESVINYAPKNKHDIALSVTSRIPVLGKPLASVAASGLLAPMMLKMANLLYKKQGRLVSFICTK